MNLSIGRCLYKDFHMIEVVGHFTGSAWFEDEEDLQHALDEHLALGSMILRYVGTQFLKMVKKSPTSNMLEFNEDTKLMEYAEPGGHRKLMRAKMKYKQQNGLIYYLNWIIGNLQRISSSFTVENHHTRRSIHQRCFSKVYIVCLTRVFYFVIKIKMCYFSNCVIIENA